MMASKCKLLATFKILLIYLSINTLSAATETGEDTDHWEFFAEGYLFAAGIKGKSAAGDIDIPFNDVVDDLDGGVMGTFDARKNKWTLAADLLYLDLDQDDNTTVNFAGTSVPSNVDVNLKGFVSTLIAAYQISEKDSVDFHLLAGLRYLWLDAELEANIGPNINIKADDSGSTVDGIIGFRGRVDLNNKWYLSGYSDIGTGESDLTWQIKAAINYRLKNSTVTAGYRYLEWEFDDNSALDDLNFSGPYAGAIWKF